MTTEAEETGLHFVRSVRPGKPIRWYVYAWRGGPSIAKIDTPKKPKVTKVLLDLQAEAKGADRAVLPGTFAGAIRRYAGDPVDPKTWSPEWAALGDGTRKTWRPYLHAIEAKWGKTNIALWSDPRMVAKVVEWRDSKKVSPRGADLGVQVLEHLLKFLRLRGEVSINVASDIPTLYRGGDRELIIWTEEDYDRFNWEAVRQDQAHISDGLWLAGYTGFRRADLVTASKAHVLETVLQKRALKKSSGKRYIVTMPRLPWLDTLLDELDTRYRADGIETLLVNSFGRPWSGDGYGGSFNRIRDAANIVYVDPDTGNERKKHLHDVRGTFCTNLILAGIQSGEPLTDEEVGLIMGWSPQRVGEIRRTYVDQHQVVVAIGERIRRGM